MPYVDTIRRMQGTLKGLQHILEEAVQLMVEGILDCDIAIVLGRMQNCLPDLT